LLECGINSQYRLFSALGLGLSVRPPAAGTPGAASVNFIGRRLEGHHGRQLAAVASPSDPRLQDLFELDFELGEALDKPGQPSPLRDYINGAREYAARWSPLKLDLLSPYIELEAMDSERLETDSPNAIFDLPPSAYALVTLDFRHLHPPTREWTYGEDWAISFTLTDDLKLGDLSRPTPMPEQFLRRPPPEDGQIGQVL
jgi:hypothetical protein